MSENIEHHSPVVQDSASPQWIRYFNSKAISSDHDYPFDFKKANWYLTIIYVVTFVSIPIIYSLVKRYAFHVTLVNGVLPATWVSWDMLFTLVLPIVGFGLAFAVDWKTMTKKGGWAAYTHFIFGIASAFLVGYLLIKTGAISGKNNDPLSLAVSFLIQVIMQFIGSLIIIFTNKSLRKQIIATFKEAKSDLLLWIVVFFAIISLLNYLFNLISNSVNGNQSLFFANQKSSGSDNQNQLVLMTKTPLGVFALILGSVFLAPVNEELSYRYGIFSVVRHKWLAYTVSFIYFPSMHVMDNGDWNNIFGYLGMGIMAPLLFICTRGNTTYNVGLHMLANAVATIVVFVNMS